LIVVMYQTGMRSAEVLHLRSKDIDHVHGTVRVLFGKGQRARPVPIGCGAGRMATN